MARHIDLTGQRFGRWIVLCYHSPGADSGKTTRSARWLVRCECGTERVTTSSALRSGHSQSCGCLNRQHVHAAHYTHGESGHARTTEYLVWHGMISRCHCESNDSYPRYGGRGITVCPEWRESYEIFLADMGRRPSPKHSIERRKNDQSYCKENCFWATPAEQARNKSSNRWLTIRGRRMCLTDWATELGIPVNTLANRVNKGWTPERIYSTRKPDPLDINLSEFVWPQA